MQKFITINSEIHKKHFKCPIIWISNKIHVIKHPWGISYNKVYRVIHPILGPILVALESNQSRKTRLKWVEKRYSKGLFTDEEYKRLKQN